MIGQTVSHYKILEKLGEGGMGVVYKAEDTKLKRTVALKFLPPELTRDKGAKTRFIREAQAASALQHHNICTIHEIDETPDGRIFISMDCYEGETLKEKIAKGPMSIDEATDITSQVAGGLSKAHEVGMVHRDIKPANIMITSDGVVKILDFGLAKLAGRTKVTKTGTTVGTVAYMSPEQATGKHIDHRSDVWSLGAVFYELLTGTLPFRGEIDQAVVYSIMNEDPKPVTEQRRDVPMALEDIIEKALSKDPARRYPTMDAFLSDLERQREHIALGIKAHRVTVLRKLRRRKQLAVGVCATVVAVFAWLAIHQGWLPGSGDDDTGIERPRPWVLVAEFDAPQGYASLGTAVRHLVIASLDESTIVEPVPPNQLTLALELAGRPESTRVDGPTARELAYRGGIKTVIEGRIDKLGSGYSVVLRALDSDDGHVICSVNDTADDEDALIPCVGRLVKRLRKEFGEQRSTLVQTQLRPKAATPSFEAYRKYVDAFELQQMQGDDRGSLVLLHDVLRIDPDFAEAWALKMLGHWHLREMDSVRVAIDQALRRPQRLTEEGRMYLRANKDILDGNLERADATYKELIRRGYQPSRSLGSRGHILYEAGRYEEALECARRAARVGPFGPRQWVLSNEIELLLMFGRVEEAREEAPKLKGWYSPLFQLAIAVTDNDWGVADSLGQVYRNDPTYPDNIHEQATVILACNKAAQGSLHGASSLFRQERRKAEGAADHGRAEYLGEKEFFLAVASWDPEIDIPGPDAVDLTKRSLIVRGLALATRRDTAEARKLLHEMRTRPEKGLSASGMLPGLLMALELELAGQWRQATDILGPLSRKAYRPDTDVNPIFVRWMTAESFRSRDLPDSAAAYLELVLSPTALPWRSRLDMRMLSSFARLRLVLLYARVGRIQEAESHLAILERDVTRPDQEMTRWIVEARDAVGHDAQFVRPAQ